MSIYSVFAEVYDQMMEEIPYEDWCSYASGLLTEYGIRDGLLLELGCGTGTLTELFAKRGYDMIGVDSSVEMLSEAMDKRAESGSDILYLQQDMREFELYGTVRAVVSLCDTMNYLTEFDDLVQVLRLVNNYLDPGGLFLFDLKTASYFSDIGEQGFGEVQEDFCYIWENSYDEAARLNEYALTLFFPEEDGRYRRFDELHLQRAYSLEELKQAAAQAGMEWLAAYSDGSKNPASGRTKRMYLLLREHGKPSDASSAHSKRKES